MIICMYVCIDFINSPILGEDFKSVDIQDSNDGVPRVVGRGSQRGVEPLDEPAEVFVVHGFGEGVARVLRLLEVQGGADDVAAGVDRAARECFAQLHGINFE